MLKKGKRILKSKEARTLIENFASLSLLQIFNYLLPMISLPYLARVIGVEKFGVLAFSVAVIAFFQAFVDFGFNYTAVRDLAKKKDNQEAVNQIFSTVMAARFFLMLIAFVLLWALILAFPLFQANKTVLLLTFLFIPGHVLFPEWFFQAMEKMKYITILNVLSKLIFVSLIFIVIREKRDFIYQPLLVALGFFVSGIVSLYIAVVSFRVRFVWPTLREIFEAIKNSANMFLSIFLPNLYSNTVTIFLRLFGGEGVVGIFDGGNKFIYISQQVSVVLSRTFYPFLARKIDKHHLYRKISFWISVSMSVLFFISADILVKVFYTPAFAASAIVIRVMAFTPILFYFYNVYGTNYLVLINKEQIVRNIIMVNSIAGIFLSWFCVKRFGYVGAAATLVMIRSLNGALLWIQAKRFMRERVVEMANYGEKVSENL